MNDSQNHASVFPPYLSLTAAFRKQNGDVSRHFQSTRPGNSKCPRLQPTLGFWLVWTVGSIFTGQCVKTGTLLEEVHQYVGWFPSICLKIRSLFVFFVLNEEIVQGEWSTAIVIAMCKHLQHHVWRLWKHNIFNSCAAQQTGKARQNGNRKRELDKHQKPRLTRLPKP